MENRTELLRDWSSIVFNKATWNPSNPREPRLDYPAERSEADIYCRLGFFVKKSTTLIGPDLHVLIG